jgi:hypothetical protein
LFKMQAVLRPLSSRLREDYGRSTDVWHGCSRITVEVKLVTNYLILL